MNVWILYGVDSTDTYHIHDWIVGIYSSLEKAEKEKSKLMSTIGDDYSEWDEISYEISSPIQVT
jgi:hypothetical protein